MYLRKGDIVKINPKVLEGFPHLDGLLGRIITIYSKNCIEVLFKADQVGIHLYTISDRDVILSSKKLRERKIQRILC